LDFLINIDKWLFSLINGEFVNSFFDRFFTLITLQRNWLLLYLVLGIWLLIKGGKRGRFAVIFLALTILAADQFSSNFLKYAVERIRPCNDIIQVRLLIDCGPGFSFPSSHAVNSFAAAVLLSRFYRENRYFFYIFAGLIAYSRVYVGVHYPFDVLAGIIIGIIIGRLFVFLYDLLSSKYKVFSV
jgi:undecaprenyl-diphosphatase